MAFTNFSPVVGDTDNSLQTKIANSEAARFGQRGHDVYGASGVHTGEWTMLHVLGSAAATVALIRDAAAETIVVPVDGWVYGRIESVNALSGLVELYK